MLTKRVVYSIRFECHFLCHIKLMALNTQDCYVCTRVTVATNQNHFHFLSEGRNIARESQHAFMLFNELYMVECFTNATSGIMTKHIVNVLRKVSVVAVFQVVTVDEFRKLKEQKIIIFIQFVCNRGKHIFHNVYVKQFRLNRKQKYY